MKSALAAIFTLALLGASAANADVVGVHVGPVHAGIGVHHHHRHHHHRHYHHRHH